MVSINKLLKYFLTTFVLIFATVFTFGGVFAESNVQDLKNEKLYKASQLSEADIEKLKSEEYSKKTIEDLKYAGYSYEEIDSLDLVSSETKYYKITETLPKDLSTNGISNSSNIETTIKEIDYDEFIESYIEEDEVGINSSQTTSTSYKLMTTTLNKINNERYKVSNSINWFEMPTNRKYDIIGIGINANTSAIPGTQYAKQTWSDSVNGTSGSAEYPAGYSKWQKDNTGYGLSFKLKGSEAFLYPDHIFMKMEYEITPNTGIKKLDAYGHYAHQEKTLSITPSFNVLRGVLSIDASIKKYFNEHLPNTHVQISK